MIAESKRIRILSHTQSGLQGDDGYKFAYKTENGIQANQVNKANTTKGSYQYTAADGKTITVNYTADETGFHPVISGNGAKNLPQAASVKVNRRG